MSNQTLRPFGMRDKLGYAMGDLGCGLSFSLVSNYMYLFYTQCIGLTAAHWAWIIIVSKVWDAINDILIGAMVDNVQIGKKSKFKPWITIGSIALVVLTILAFAPVTTLPQLGKIIWCLVVYCLWSVAYTMVNVPYGSLHSVITDDPKGRTALSTFRSIGAAFGMLLVMILPKVVYENNELSTNRVFIVSVVFSIGALIFLNLMKTMVTERAVVPVRKTKVNYLKTVSSYFTNRPLVAVTIATVAAVTCFNSTMSANNLVFQFFFGDADKATLGTIGAYIPMIIIMPLTGLLAGKLGKKKFISLASLIGTIAGVLMLIIPITPDKNGMIVYIVGLMFISIGNSVFQVIVWAIVADSIEVNFHKTGVREESSLYAIYSFFRKLSQGIGQALIALVLQAVGYVETSQTQTAEVAQNIKTTYIAFLLVGTAIVFVSMQFIYNIDKKKELENAKLSQSMKEA